ncbi:hypothetical protein Taro_010996 [Colocasia esculenta]|uniref:Uncharacterized protein n=1 Tax=Colocasia esculenta TaxID=4460 RepID=A0A843U8P1_COLES|nr:hypothetical protein [Colocasia esculenta]
MKAKRFLNGLNPQYITQLAPLDIQTYAEMVKKAQLLEDATNFTDRIKGKFVKKELTSGQSSARPNNGNNLTEGPSQERKPKAIVPYTPAKSNYKHYDKPGHTVDECWRKVDACLRCGSREHRIPEPCERDGPIGRVQRSYRDSINRRDLNAMGTAVAIRAPDLTESSRSLQDHVAICEPVPLDLSRSVQGEIEDELYTQEDGNDQE